MRACSPGGSIGRRSGPRREDPRERLAQPVLLIIRYVGWVRHVTPTAIGVLLLAGALAACATPASSAEPADPSHPVDTTSPAVTPEAPTLPSATPSDPAAAAQAQAWLDAISLPDGAVPGAAGTAAASNTYTAWPCTPVEQLDGRWTVPGATLADVASWVLAHPPAGLITTTPGQTMDDPSIDGGSIGFIPEPDAQEGVVLNLSRSGSDVFVHADVAALTDDATCKEPPGGGSWGAPGQG